MRVTVPDFALVVLIGATGSGKTTFAAAHFRATEIVSSDRCRALVSDDENDQSATDAAFDVLYTIAAKRLVGRKLTVIDATNLRSEDRAKGIELARKYHAIPVAFVLDVDPEVCVERNRSRRKIGLCAQPGQIGSKVRQFIEALVSHYWLDDGKLVVAHAGLRAEMQGRGSREVHEFALYGETTGETDEFGLPVRYNWASEYRSASRVVYGHTPVPKTEWLNNTICIDTGCVYGGRLTALRYPELELVDVGALRTYVEPVRTLTPPDNEATVQQLADDVAVGDQPTSESARTS